jgi:hypothetical protein
MQTKLTLRLDDQLIAQAKLHAERSGKSLSQIVAEFFALMQRAPAVHAELTPTVAKLKGAWRGKDVDVADYREHLDRKYR